MYRLYMLMCTQDQDIYNKESTSDKILYFAFFVQWLGNFCVDQTICVYLQWIQNQNTYGHRIDSLMGSESFFKMKRLVLVSLPGGDR